jgi:hypothetical protein
VCRTLDFEFQTAVTAKMIRRMGGAKRYPSFLTDAALDGFRFALPIQQRDPHHGMTSPDFSFSRSCTLLAEDACAGAAAMNAIRRPENHPR